MLTLIPEQINDLKMTAREEFKTITEDNESRSGTGVLFVPKIANVTAERIGQALDRRGLSEIGDLIEVDFGFDPRDKFFSSDHHVAKQQKRNQGAAMIKAVLGFMYNGNDFCLDDVNKLAAGCLIRDIYGCWATQFDSVTNIVDLRDGTSVHHNRGYGSIDIGNDSRAGLGVACSPGYDNHMRDFIYQAVQHPLKQITITNIKELSTGGSIEDIITGDKGTAIRLVFGTDRESFRINLESDGYDITNIPILFGSPKSGMPSQGLTTSYIWTGTEWKTLTDAEATSLVFK